MFPTFGGLGTSGYSIEKLQQDSSRDINFTLATNILDAMNLLVLKVTMYPMSYYGVTWNWDNSAVKSSCVFSTWQPFMVANVVSTKVEPRVHSMRLTVEYA